MSRLCCKRHSIFETAFDSVRFLNMAWLWRPANSNPAWIACSTGDPSTPDNRRFAKHLAHEQPWIFSFLHCPGLDATNNVAERAIRPAVVARHTWGGNRTATGAATQQILMSVLRTYGQQQKDSFASFVQLLRSRDSQI